MMFECEVLHCYVSQTTVGTSAERLKRSSYCVMLSKMPQVPPLTQRAVVKYLSKGLRVVPCK